MVSWLLFAFTDFFPRFSEANSLNTKWDGAHYTLLSFWKCKDDMLWNEMQYTFMVICAVNAGDIKQEPVSPLANQFHPFAAQVIN